MIVHIPLIPREDARKEVQEKYKYSVQTADGTLTFAYVNTGCRWGIYEYTTGLSVLADIGKLTKRQFIAFTDLFAKLGSQKIKAAINENEKVNGGGNGLEK